MAPRFWLTDIAWLLPGGFSDLSNHGAPSMPRMRMAEMIRTDLCM